MSNAKVHTTAPHVTVALSELGGKMKIRLALIAGAVALAGVGIALPAVAATSSAPQHAPIVAPAGKTIISGPDLADYQKKHCPAHPKPGERLSVLCSVPADAGQLGQ
jgi:hypothetical protein